MNAFTIKDVENLSGIQAHTLRIWEQRYDFLKPQRTHTNIRHYNDDELKTILKVALLNRFGYRISRISKMSKDEMAEKIIELVPVEAKYQHTIHVMLEQMIEMQLDEFDSLLTRIIEQLGLQQATLHVLFPFLERMGILWATDRINPAQEHFVSNIIRQKLLSATNDLPVPLQSSNKVLMFLPEGEAHEIGILFIQYLIKNRGLQNWYLGANVPLEDIAFVANAKQPSYLYTHLTAVTQSFSLEKFISLLHEKVPHITLIISGPITKGYEYPLPHNVKMHQNLQDIFSFINSLNVS